MKNKDLLHMLGQSPYKCRRTTKGRGTLILDIKHDVTRTPSHHPIVKKSHEDTSQWSYDRESTKEPLQNTYVDCDLRDGRYYLISQDGKVERLTDPTFRRTPHPPYNAATRSRDSVARLIVEFGLRFENTSRCSVITYSGVIRDEDGMLVCIYASYRRDGVGAEERRVFTVIDGPLCPDSTTTFYGSQSDIAATFASWIRERGTRSQVLMVGFGESFSSVVGERDLFKIGACGNLLPKILILCGGGGRRSGMHREQFYFAKGGMGISHSTIFGHNVHIVDARKWLNDDYALEPRMEIPEDDTLCAHISVAKLSTYISDGDCTQRVSLLHKLIDARDLYTKLSANIKSSGLPPSFVLFQTQANCAMASFSRELYALSPDMCFPFCRTGTTSDQNFTGGFTSNTGKEHYTDTTCVMLDFQGFYPSIIRATGISPFATIVESDRPLDQTKYVVIHNYGDDIAEQSLSEWIGISLEKTKNDIAFSAAIENFIIKRIAAKEEAVKWAGRAKESVYPSPEYDDAVKRMMFYNHLQLAEKRKVNAVSGLMGAKNQSYWSNRKTAVVMTLCGRIAVTSARSTVEGGGFGKVLFIDTDSLCVQLSKPLPDIDFAHEQSVTAFRDKVANYCREMQTSVIDAMPINFVDRRLLKLSLDNVMLTSYFPTQKKSYIKLSLDPLLPKTNFDFRGFQFAGRTNHVRERTLYIAEVLLRAKKSEWPAMIAKFKDDESSAIPKRPDMYSRTVRLGEKSQLAHSICRRFPEIVFETTRQKTETHVVVTKQGTCKGVDMWIPLEKLTEKTPLNIEATFNFCYGYNLSRYFPDVQFYDTIGRPICASDELIHVHTMPHNRDMYVSAGELFGIITRDPDECYYEVFDNEEIRLLFDLDHPDTDFRINEDFVDPLLKQFGWPVPIIMDGSGPGKRSYHIVFPLCVQLSYNEEVSRYLKEELGYGEMIDTGIYRIRCSIRLPLCSKYIKNGHKIEQRRFRIPDGVDFSSCIVTNIDGLPRCKDWGMAFSPRIPIDLYVSSTCPLNIIDDVPKTLKEFLDTKFPLGYDIQQTRSACTARIVPKNKPYDCPFCKRAHESDSLRLDRCGNVLKLSCFRGTRNRCNTYLLGSSTVEENKKKTRKTKKKGDRWDGYDIFRAAIDSMRLPTGDEKEELDPFVLDASTKILFIRSQPKTLKTTRLREYMATHCTGKCVIVWISFRRTYTTDIAAKTGFLDYRSVEGELLLKPGMRVIIQIDSIQRLRLFQNKYISLLIMDEVESIQTQLYNATQHNKELTKTLYAICSKTERFVVMDALLNDATIQALREFAGVTYDNITIINNVYKPFKKMRAQVFQVKLALPDEMGTICETMHSYLKNGERLVGVITSRKLTEALEEFFVGAGYRVKCYTGNDLRVNDDQKSMYAKKCSDFTNISDVIEQEDVQLLLYTTTVTGGVSVETVDRVLMEAGSVRDKYGMPWFDRLIGYYCSAIHAGDFTQAICRVRNFKKDECYIYVEPVFDMCLDTTPLECERRYEMLKDRFSVHEHFSQISHYDVFLAARDAALRKHSWRLMFQQLACMGFEFDIHHRAESKSSTFCLEVFGKDARRVYETMLTMEHIKLCCSLSKDEIRTKLELSDHTFEYAYYKAKIMRRFHLTVDEVNILPLEVFEKALPDTHLSRRATKAILREQDSYDRLSFQDKLAVIKHLHNLQGDANVTPSTSNAAGDMIVSFDKERDDLLKAREKEICLKKSAISIKREEIAYTEAVAFAEWLRSKGGSITINSSLAKAKKVVPVTPHDEVTREFLQELSKVSNSTWILLGDERCRDPCIKAEDLLKHAKVNTLLKRRYVLHNEMKFYMALLSIQ